MKNWLRFALLASLLALPGGAFARDKPAPTSPGKYTDWGGEIDELEIVASFKLADYGTIVVEPFDTSAAPLPPKDDNTYAPVQYVLAHVTLPFKDGLAESLRTPVALAEPGKTAGSGDLVVRGKVIQMDPGSKAARYWAGFGAGAARTEIDGEVVDGSTGKVLLHFRQERRSGVGTMGGDYEKLMDRNLRTIGEDIAGVLKHF